MSYSYVLAEMMCACYYSSAKMAVCFQSHIHAPVPPIRMPLHMHLPRSILVGTRFRQRPRLGPPREPVYHFILTDHFIPHPRCWQVGPLSSVDRIAVVTNGRDEEGSAKNWWCTDDAKVCQQAFQKTINENCNILCFQAVPETAEESRDV